MGQACRKHFARPLKEIVEANLFFNVPIYQRLYVWGDDQVRTLLADLLSAHRENRDIFYLGGTLVVERQTIANGSCFDLVDGQQRFTTLWMMSLVWQNALQPFLFRQEQDSRRPRIAFPIRPGVNQFFAQRMAGIEALGPILANWMKPKTMVNRRPQVSPPTTLGARRRVFRTRGDLIKAPRAHVDVRISEFQFAIL